MPMQQGPRFYIPLESTFLFDTPAMSSVTGNHTMDLSYPLRENLLLKISFLTYWSWQGASEICFIYQVVQCHWGDSEEYTPSYCEALNQTLLAQKYRGLSSNTFYGLEDYGTH